MLRLDIKPLLKDWRIESVIIYQGDTCVAEWYERGEDAVRPLYSCTKSVLSALIGIAIDRGDLSGADSRLGSYLKSHIESGSEPWLDVTIKQLLTMTPGFHWPDFDKPYKELRSAQDPVTFALSQPIVHVPGQSFTYNSGGSHLLSAILSHATGMSAMQYARKYLFEPLGFQAAKWTERNGISEGGTGLALTGTDLARFGLLYLRRGRWGPSNILSSSWIDESTALHHRALLQYEPHIYGGYGYHWWCSPEEHNGAMNVYFAFGHGGQYLMILPDIDAVIVVRKRITKRNDAIYSRRLIFEHIVPWLRGVTVS
ncbi:serine hydrolase domain-containing protein [Paenibacillus sp. strain BS8-2]